MKIINPYTEISPHWMARPSSSTLSCAGGSATSLRTKSPTPSAAKFVAGIIKRGHEAVLEHFDITVKFVCDRGVSHEIVRHRMASYCQESTRYCNYSKDVLAVNHRHPPLFPDGGHTGLAVLESGLQNG